MNDTRMEYTVAPLGPHGQLEDVIVQLADGKSWRMWGRAGAEREAALAAQAGEGELVLLLGSGLGFCLAELLGRGPVAVVDREEAILGATGVLERLGSHPDLHVLSGDAEEVTAQLAALRSGCGVARVRVLRMPLYLRLAPQYYRDIEERANAMNEFQAAMRYPRFESALPRVLLLEKPYFLYREIRAALDRLGSCHHCVPLPASGMLEQGFVRDLLTAIAEFKPDFALTVNHFGLDQEGRLAGLLAELELPLASWFVDSPQLILNDFPHQNTPGTCVFTYDAANLDWLSGAGFDHVHYLPLGTDPELFRPGGTAPAVWRAEVSFVGDSMTSQVADMAAAARIAPKFSASLEELAWSFARSGHVLPMEFLADCHEDVHAEVASLPSVAARLACEKALTFTAARQYRLQCVSGILPYEPLIAGDEGWSEALGKARWRAAGRLDYYRDLPLFYSAVEVNFNCTSVQMKGAVNQRVFDVPASGGFLVTDWRAQMEELFDPGSEVACYHAPEEVEYLVAAWLADSAGREQMAAKARARILAEHTYEHRLSGLIGVMRRTYG